MSENESNRDKFVRLAQSRTTKAIKSIRLIGKLSDRSNYSYNEADVKKIISALRAEIAALQHKFDNSSLSDDIDFKL